MSDKVFNMLFLCTGNSARSIMAESIVNHWGKPRFQGFSAGSQPVGQVNPMTLKLLERLKISHQGVRSKSWDEFAREDSPQMDFVITVCGQAAGEQCPVFPGIAMRAHWGIEDPAAVDGDEETRIQAFHKAFLALESRIKIFVNLPNDKLSDAISLQRKLDELGQSFSPE